MIYPGTESAGSYSMGDPNDLDERKRQLIQKLLASGGRNQSGLTGLHAMPLFGGYGRSASDLPTASLPQISFNPFLAMAAGRPQEVFQAPQGVTAAALAQAQAGLHGNVGGPAPQEISNPAGDAAAAAFLGTTANNPGVTGPSTATPQPTAGSPQQAYLPQATAPRHLAGGGNPLQTLPSSWIPRLGSFVAM